MREIKFRGHDGTAWRYGDLIHDRCNGHELIFIDDNVERTRHSVKQDTVGQYTGLKDLTGKEIYEGDVLECLAIDDGPFTVRVVFRNGAFHTDVHDGVNGADFTCLLVDIFALGDVRIVGNIWDGYPKFVSIAGMGGFEK